MDSINNFAFKQKKYMPIFPKARGKPTIYIEGYPFEDDEPMAATEFHGEQISTFYDQLSRYYAIHEHIHVGVDNFIYYREGDITKFVAPDVYVVLGVDKYPLRRSFYTWSEGAVPSAVFEFLSDATANRDRHEKAELYLVDIGVQEYYIHQPELKKSAEFRGWRPGSSGGIVEILPDARGGLFSDALNLWFRWEADETTHVRLLRPYLPDGIPITTSLEDEHLRERAQELQRQEHDLRMQEQLRRMQEQEQHLREAAEAIAEQEAERRQEAETLAKQEAERRREAEVELERLRAQLSNQRNKNT